MRSVVVDDRGSGDALVYVPGIDASGELLLGTAARLREAFRLVRLRHVADDARSDDRYAHMAASIVAALDERGIERAALIAESFGGAVALTCALEHPERVRALAIVNSFAQFPQRARLALSRLGSRVVPRSIFEFARPRIAPWSLFGRRREADAIRDFRALTGVPFDSGYARRLSMIAGLDLRPRLSEIAQPTSLFASTHDRVLPSMRCARVMLEGLPAAELHVVEGGGHVILPLASIPWVEHIQALLARAA